ncbi:hypothetical protein BJY04DRAFT_184892 [Aspergillus karnatakaensis]|uniref:uncharacterized protein n=1 Tax=Aspergillus karnatakaensis TaxID=1810916 RepID=UPI003CCCF644
MPMLKNPPVKAAAAAAAQIFEREAVPYVMHGWTALALVGEDLGYNDIDFVIPQKDMDRAIEVLNQEQYRQCTRADCIELQVDRMPWLEALPEDTPAQDKIKEHAYMAAPHNRYHPVATVHFHRSGSIVISLHHQECMLWWLPELQAGPMPQRDDTFILSNDKFRVVPRGTKFAHGPLAATDPVYRQIHTEGRSDGSSGPWSIYLR